MTWIWREDWPFGGGWEIRGKDCLISLEPRPRYCDRGNWLAKLYPEGDLAREIDHQDGWPRYYFDLGRAKLEIEAWLAKRGQET
jgi:hypothetical protein